MLRIKKFNAKLHGRVGRLSITPNARPPVLRRSGGAHDVDLVRRANQDTTFPIAMQLWGIQVVRTRYLPRTSTFTHSPKFICAMAYLM